MRLAQARYVVTNGADLQPFLRVPLATMNINKGTVLIAAAEQEIASTSHKACFPITSISALIYYYYYYYYCHYHHHYS